MVCLTRWFISAPFSLPPQDMDTLRGWWAQTWPQNRSALPTLPGTATAAEVKATHFKPSIAALLSRDHFRRPGPGPAAAAATEAGSRGVLNGRGGSGGSGAGLGRGPPELACVSRPSLGTSATHGEGGYGGGEAKSETGPRPGFGAESAGTQEVAAVRVHSPAEKAAAAALAARRKAERRARRSGRLEAKRAAAVAVAT